MKITCFPPVFVVACLLINLPLSVRADVLASYSFTEGSIVSSDTDLTSMASPFSAGAGITADYSSEYAAAPNGDIMDPAFGFDKAYAIDNDNYFEFSISPNSLFSVSLDEISMVAADMGTSISGSRRTQFFMRSDIDNYVADVISFNENRQASPYTFSPHSIVLSSNPTFQNLTAPITFRIYLVSNSTGSGAIRAAIDNIVVEGTTAAIPEPSTFTTLLVVGLLGLTTRRQPRR